MNTHRVHGSGHLLRGLVEQAFMRGKRNQRSADLIRRGCAALDTVHRGLRSPNGGGDTDFSPIRAFQEGRDRLCWVHASHLMHVRIGLQCISVLDCIGPTPAICANE